MKSTSQTSVKYSSLIVDWLTDLGYSHCFFVPGGNSMHLLDGARSKMKCVPFIHEMSASIAAEYFNETSKSERAWVLLTAGPGLTHSVSAFAGAYLEGRSLLVLGGQVKTSDLAAGGIRQRGIQEVDGVSIVRPICKLSIRLDHPVSENEFKKIVNHQFDKKPGPVFVEICLDVQGSSVQVGTDLSPEMNAVKAPSNSRAEKVAAMSISKAIKRAQRPVILVGGGVRRGDSRVVEKLLELGVPVMTTYNGADRIGSEFPLYFGRPNTWGMRYSNILIGQSDLVVALGTRLGLQQTGFNWSSFAPVAKVIQVDIDRSELEKGHPVISEGFDVDAINCLLQIDLENTDLRIEEWVTFCGLVKNLLPTEEEVNSDHEGFWDPYNFMAELSELATSNEMIVPCSSGGSFTCFYQSFANKLGQVIISNKSLASMGYGLAGALGASLSNLSKRTLLVEGDGGFSQNLQELATLSVHQLNVKIFLMCNEGYASIRMTQKSYFDGAYLGCDTRTGLGFPDWHNLAKAYKIGCSDLPKDGLNSESFLQNFNSPKPHIFVVRVHPEQTFFPKISSRINDQGSMESEPLWEISPRLPTDLQRQVFKYFKREIKEQ